jgi:hypothetical protein
MLLIRVIRPTKIDDWVRQNLLFLVLSQMLAKVDRSLPPRNRQLHRRAARWLLRV